MDKQDEKELTRISKNNKTRIKNTDMTPQEILAFLESGAIYRTFKDVLAKVYPGEDINRVLTNRLCEMDEGKNRDTVARNVRNWMNGINTPQREQLFQICFALNMDEAQANQVLASASDTGIHYRNPEELIYAYCLRMGKTWNEAVALRDEMLPDDKKKRRADEKARKEKAKKETADKTGVGADMEQVKKYTRQIREEFNSQVTNDEELKAFLRDSSEMFGTIHETAYEEFMKMLDILQNPDRDYEENAYFKRLKKLNAHKKLRDYEMRELDEHEEGLKERSVTEVIEKFMQMHVPENAGRGEKKGKGSKNEQGRDYTYLQKVIQKNWPSESILYKMRTREIDVTRKVMLLLFLLTEEFEVSDPNELAGGYGYNAGEDEEDEYFDYFEAVESEDAGERMEVRLNQMNLFLDNFGMNRLDPGNPFDCIVLYALKASYTGGDDDDPMSGRMERTLEILFQN